MTYEELKERVDALTGDREEHRIYAEQRRLHANDPYLPGYHFWSPGGYLNDPCGYCYFKGIWHLFYQFITPHTGALGWGHAVSTDQIRWIDLPAAIMPTVEICCGSGGACIDGDRLVACYQGDLADNPGGAIHISESSDELLADWHRTAEGPAITTQKPDGTKNPYNAFDPCMWKEGDTFYLLSAGGGSLPHPFRVEDLDFRRFYLFSSPDAREWKYEGSLLEDDIYASFGDDGACPYFLPFGDKHILLHFSHMSGGKFVIGSFDREKLKFHAENGGSFNTHSWMSGGVHAPSACTDGRGGVHCIFNMNFGCRLGDPVNQIMGLPRRFRPGHNNTLLEEPDGDFASLRYDPVREENRLIEANTETLLEGVNGQALEIDLTADTEMKSEPLLTIAAGNIPVFELRVLRSPDSREYTAIRFYRNRSRMDWEVFNEDPFHWAHAADSVVEVDTSSSTLAPNVAIHPTEHQNVKLRYDEPIKLRVFVDRSIVEVFANGQRCVAVRTYPTLPESTGVSVISRGVPVKLTYEAWKMRSIYDGQ